MVTHGSNIGIYKLRHKRQKDTDTCKPTSTHIALKWHKAQNY